MIEYQIIKSDFALDKIFHSRWIKSVLEAEGFTEGQIGYIFCDDDFLLTINQKFLNHDTFTDIVTFPLSDDNSDIISGEIYISVDRVIENASKFDVSFERELDRVIVHGVLHLMGYDDHSEGDKALMSQKEDYYLSLQPEK